VDFENEVLKALAHFTRSNFSYHHQDFTHTAFVSIFTPSKYARGGSNNLSEDMASHGGDNDDCRSDGDEDDGRSTMFLDDERREIVNVN